MHLRREILIRNFNKRERILLELIHELTVDIKRDTVKFAPGAMTAVGLHRNHIYLTFTRLLQSRVVLKDGSGYRINPTVAEWQVEFLPEYQEKGLKKLFYQQYRTEPANCHQNSGSENHQNSGIECHQNGSISVKEKESSKEKKKNIIIII